MNKKVVYGLVGVILIALLGIGGFFTVSGKKGTPTTVEDEMETIESIDAKEIGLALEPTADKKKVVLVMENPKGIKHVEYEITYDADSKDPESKRDGVKVSRGFNDEKDITDDSAKFSSKEYFLGTCSSGTCIPDTGVVSIKATVKITKSDGKIYQSDASIDL